VRDDQAKKDPALGRVCVSGMLKNPSEQNLNAEHTARLARIAIDIIKKSMHGKQRDGLSTCTATLEGAV
jgi:hypothetical protein